MKIVKRGFTGIATLALIFSTLVISPQKTNASETDVQLAKSTVNSYIKAVEKQDPEEMVKWVIDKRFTSSEQQKSEYNVILRNNEFNDAKLENIKKTGETIKATISLKRKNDGRVESVELPVVKDMDSTWKLVIGDVSTRDEKSIVYDTSEKKSSNPNMSTLSTAVAYYEFDLAKQGSCCTHTAYSDSSFDMTGYSVGINGWQELPSTNTKVTVVYQIVKKGVFSDDVKGEKIIQDFYRKKGTWYYETISTFEKESGVYLKITNPSSTNGVYGAGNVYQ
ncbi:hypothetical protein [Paenibacillus hamazuiensis]|uniref:hypothetical protein n=1 Tax=Paenibacillus hamazuiensis TaxID=2936508 RepID=UPI00200C84BF|nr:hypothetical protein [Paenibacillus hamazuiensis]